MGRNIQDSTVAVLMLSTSSTTKIPVGTGKNNNAIARGDQRSGVGLRGLVPGESVVFSDARDRSLAQK